MIVILSTAFIAVVKMYLLLNNSNPNIAIYEVTGANMHNETALKVAELNFHVAFAVR